MNLQQIILCSARKIRSNNSTLGASGIASGWYGFGADPNWRHFGEKAICAQFICWWSDCIYITGLQAVRGLSTVYTYSTCSKPKVLFYALRDPRLWRTLYPGERWLHLAYIQLTFPCCCYLKGGILFPRFLDWGRSATGNPGTVRWSLSNPCHTREQHFCKTIS